MSIIMDANAPAGGSSQGGLIKEASNETFMEDVVNASMERPVIVDFWAPGCQPCETLTPLLEKLVTAAGGAIALVKVNAQECQEIAMQLRIQSVPTVYCFKDGRPIDGFQGAVGESEVRKFIDKHTEDGGNPVAQGLAQAGELMENGDAASAQQIFMHVLQHDQGNPEAIAGVIRCHMKLDNLDAAREIAEQLPDDLKRNEHIASAIAALDLAGAADVDTAELEARLANDANDHQARFDLAMAFYGGGRSEEALNELLEIVRKDRNWKDDGARQQMLKIFEAIGLDDPVVLKARRKLTSVMF